MSGALIGPIGLAGMAICTGACLAYQCRQMKNCIVAYTVQRDLNLANLRLDLQACGVNFADT